MTSLISLHNALAARLDRADWLLPTLARFLFAAILLLYFWSSAFTKLGDGLFGLLSPSAGAYAQIFPRAFEAVGYDSAQLSALHWAIALAGTWAEFLLPALIVLGLLTRVSALAMLGFLAVQTATDLFGHGALSDPAALGAWFDNAPGALLFDQRSLWAFLLITLVIKGAGPLSLDTLFARALPPARDPA